MTRNHTATTCSVRTVLICLGLGLLSAGDLHGQSDAASLNQQKAVGPVTVELELSPAAPVIGDQVKLTIRAIAENGVELLMPEFGEALSKYSVLEFVPKSEEQGDQRVETQIYTLQPITSGPQSIPPILVEFVDNRPGQQATPDDFDAYEILSDRIDFEVQSVLDPGETTLAPPMPKLEIVAESASSKSWYWLAALVAVALAAIVGVVLLRRRTGSRSLSPFEVASQRLDLLRRDRGQATPSLSIDEFFVEISAAIREYVEGRFSIKAPDLTTDEFLARASESQELSGHHQGLLKEFLEQADMIKFAGVQAGNDDVNRSLELATQFLRETKPGAQTADTGGNSSTTDRVAASGDVAVVGGTQGEQRGGSGGLEAAPQADSPSANRWDTRPTAERAGGSDV